MKADYYEVDCRPAEQLYVAAARYRPDNEPSEGLTLILAHGVGMHKETWVPLLQYLFELQQVEGGPKILEAWSIECPNHGRSALRNEESLKANYPEYPWDSWIYPRVILSFLQSQPDGVDFRQRKVVLIGHSYGGHSLMLLDQIQISFIFEAFILLDATVAHDTAGMDDMGRILVEFTRNKREAWPSREAAQTYLMKQPGTRNWHPEVIKLFIEYGFRDDASTGGVTLACSRNAEAGCYIANDHRKPAWNQLQRLYREGIIVHLIHSRKDEFGAVGLKRDQAAPESTSGKGPRSVQYIEKGGHMFVQSMPEATAKAIYNALCDLRLNRSSGLSVSASL